MTTTWIHDVKEENPVLFYAYILSFLVPFFGFLLFSLIVFFNKKN